MIETSPLSLIDFPHFEQRVIQTVPEDQVADILRLTDPVHARTARERFRAFRNRAMVILLWDTPGRRSEFANLKAGNVNLDMGVMLVMGKGRRERTMPFGQTASAALWEYLEVRRQLAPDNDALWVLASGVPMTPGFYATIKILGERAGVPDLHTHRFRHSFTMNALRSKMPQHVLMMIAGWKRKIPDTYFQTLGEEDAVRFHREMSPADKLWGSGEPKHPGSKKGKTRGRL